VEIAPKKTDVNLRRSKQFAIVKPSTKTRVDLGIKTRKLIQEKWVEDAGRSLGMATPKISLNMEDEVDDQRMEWLKQAYDGV